MGPLLDAIVLGLVQGLTEFLPISSSGHLAIFQRLLGWEDPDANLAFSVAVHFGSLGAVVVFAWREIAAMLTSHKRLLLVLAVATLPIAVLGSVLKPLVAELAANLLAVGGALLVTAGLLALVRHRGHGALKCADLPLPRALLVGLAQAVAVVPGLSRSGATLVAGLTVGLEREQAVRFAFLMAAPAILGAGLFLTIEGSFERGVPFAAVAAGTFVSFAASLFAMKVTVDVVKRERLGWFAFYCALAAGVAFGLGAAR